MNKKNVVVVVMMVLMIVLTGCGGGGGEKSGKASVTSSPAEFITLTEVYFEKQQALMMKQAEGLSGEFAEVSQHAKDVVGSDEYLEWEKEVEKVKNFKLKKGAESEEYLKLQAALNDYGKIQADYFQGLAKATDQEAYNEVNTKLADQLGSTQDKFIEIMESIDE